MSKIIAIHGNTIPGAPNQDMIEDLTRLLEQAKAGHLEGIAYCTVRSGEKGTGWVGNSGTRDAIGSSILMLSHRYASALLSAEDCDP